MKRVTYLLLLLLFLLPSVFTYGQEEFFGNQQGVSLSYLNGLNTSVRANAAGLSFYNKNAIFGMGVETVGSESAPMFTILLCPGWSEKPREIKMYFGPSYSYILQHHIVGLDLGLVKCFFPESNFPFSIHGACSLQAVMGNQSDMNFNLTPILGYGYNQAFFAHGKIYPTIGIARTYDLSSESGLVSISVGLNIKLDSNSAEK